MKIWYSFLVIFLNGLTYAQNSGLKSYDFSKSTQVKLDYSLNEISGLAFMGDKLFVHEDENSHVFQLDAGSGKIIKKFTVGQKKIMADFEDIAVVGDKFYLVTSDGDIYSFSEANDGGKSDYKKYSTGLDMGNIEGLCYDELTNSLLVACKGNLSKNYKGTKAIFSFDLKTNKMNTKPRFLISLKDLKNKYGINNFSPSAMKRNSKTGTFFILSSHEKSIAEINSDGKIINVIKLDESKHQQPEGLAFTSDGSLLISDEGKNGSPTLTRYGLKK